MIKGMSEYVRLKKARRGAVANVAYIGLNLILGVLAVAVTVFSGTWVFGILLVLASKWRVFAVMPRFWLVNLLSNLVDVIVGVSVVLLSYLSGQDAVLIQILLVLAYSVWLILIKPRTSELAAETQAYVATFLALSAVAILVVQMQVDSIVFVATAFVVGYSALRHILTQSEDHDFEVVVLAGSLFFAEFVWIVQHWLILYSFGQSGFVVPQVAIIGTLAMFMFVKLYKAVAKHDGKLRASDAVLPAIFSVFIILVMVLWFSRPMLDV
jgi:hypothetical protein